jgi:hypothetical protein
MPAPNTANTVVDEANRRTYVILAPRVLTEGELYRAIRQGIFRRGGGPLAQGETLTSSGGRIASATELEPETEPPGRVVPHVDEPGHFSFPADPLG